MKNKALLIPKNARIDWQILEHTLRQQFGVHAIVFDQNGERRTQEDISWANSICAAVKTNPNGNEHVWSATQRRMCCDARKKECCVREECPIGMVKMVVPIMSEDSFEGFVCVGGRPFVNIHRIYTNTLQRILEISEEEIQRHLIAVKPINYYTIKDIMAYITSYN